MVDSHLPRFSQAVQAIALAVAFVADLRWLVPVLAAALAAAVLGGPRLNPFAYLYRAVPIPRGEIEPAAPHRFSQSLGVVFLTTGSLFLYAAAAGSVLWWTLGWGPALAVAVLAFVAATTSF